MSKVTMPEPVALTNPKITGITVYGYTHKQMKAYAAAKVREALEEAAETCTNSMMMNTDSYCGATGRYCAGRIRALINTKESKNG